MFQKLKKWMLLAILVFFSSLSLTGCQQLLALLTGGTTPTEENNAPVVEEMTARPDSIYSGEESRIEAVGKDEDGDSLTYEWLAQKVQGAVDVSEFLAITENMAVFTGPEVSEQTEYEVLSR